MGKLMQNVGFLKHYFVNTATGSLCTSVNVNALNSAPIDRSK